MLATGMSRPKLQIPQQIHGFEMIASKIVMPLLLATLFLIGADGVAAEEHTAARPRVALVLSGGGARGAAHFGVLKVLEEMRVPIDACWDAQTARARDNFPVSGMGPLPVYVWATALVKWATARANTDLGVLDEQIGTAIMQAAEEVMAVGCKLRKLRNPGFRNPPWGSCIAPRACWFKGS